MSFARMLLASSAAIALIASAADASAQYQYYGRQQFDRQKYERPASTAARSVRAPKAAIVASRTPTATVGKPASQPVRTAPPPLTEEQLAAKAAVEELLGRDPALAAAKERPDPKLAQAAAARHKAEEQRLAAVRAKEEAAAAKRKGAAGKVKPREDAKVVANATQDAQSNSTAAKPHTNKSKADSKRLAASATPLAPAQPLRRMPTP
jgi:competence protein ComEA